MRDQHHGAVVRTQEVFQPTHGVDVKVVGRLVKQQTVRVQQQQTSEFGPHLPAA